MRRGKAVIAKNKKGEFYFRLVAANGQILCVSEGYVKKASCEKTLKNLFERQYKHVDLT